MTMIKPKIGAVAATSWFMRSNAALGGMSPMEAIKSGMENEVRKAATTLLTGERNAA